MTDSGAGYTKVSGFDSIMEYVSPIIYHENNKSCCYGTAVIIAYRISLTAKHVIEQYLVEQGIVVEPGDNIDVTFNLLVLQRAENKDMSWFVKKVYFSNATDIAILYLTPANDNADTYSFSKMTIDLHLPYLNTKVAGFGYPKSKVTQTGDNMYDLDLDSHTTSGTVNAVYGSRRDSSMLNFPCFEVNTRIEGGMSGGPIFSQDTGHLIGIMCSGWDFSDSKEHSGYVASIWPLLPTLIDIPRESTEPSKYRFWELVKDGTISAHGQERLTVKQNSDLTETYAFNYDKGFSNFTEDKPSIKPGV